MKPLVTKPSPSPIAVLGRLLAAAQHNNHYRDEMRLERLAAEILFFIQPPDPVGSVHALVEICLALRERQAGRLTSTYGDSPTSHARGNDAKTAAIARRVDIEDRVRKALARPALRKMLIDAGFGEFAATPAQCSVCASAFGVEVDARLAAGETVREIATWSASTGDVPLSRSAIGRHRAACWAARRQADPDSLRTQIEVLRAAAERSLREAQRLTRLVADWGAQATVSQDGGTDAIPDAVTN
jgi:hypothetical protein